MSLNWLEEKDRDTKDYGGGSDEKRREFDHYVQDNMKKIRTALYCFKFKKMHDKKHSVFYQGHLRTTYQQLDIVRSAALVASASHE